MSIVNWFKNLRKKFIYHIMKKEIIKRGNIIMNDNTKIKVAGIEFSEKELMEYLTKWVVESFIFKGNDVYLPEVPANIFMNDEEVKEKYPNIDIENFKKYLGNASVQYLSYRLFITGYYAGLQQNIKSESEVEEIIKDFFDDTKEKDIINNDKLLEENDAILDDNKKIEIKDLPDGIYNIFNDISNSFGCSINDLLDKELASKLPSYIHLRVNNDLVLYLNDLECSIDKNEEVDLIKRLMF